MVRGPGVALFALVLGLNLLGDGLGDARDTRRGVSLRSGSNDYAKTLAKPHLCLLFVMAAIGMCGTIAMACY